MRKQQVWQRRLAKRPIPWGIAMGMLGAVCLGAIPPSLAVHAQSDDESFFTHLHTEKAMANVTILPGRAGPVDITIQLETADERPLTARAVSVTLTNTQSGIAPQTAEAVRTGDQWLVKMSAPTAGRWMLALGITLPDFDKVSVESPVLIR
jgi:hypothetical protein